MTGVDVSFESGTRMKGLATAAVAIFAALMLTGCLTSEGSSCLSDQECDSDQLCQRDQNVCVIACSDDDQCNSGECIEDGERSFCELEDPFFNDSRTASSGDVDPEAVANVLADDNAFLATVATLLTTLFIDELRGPVGQSGSRGPEGPMGPEGPEGPIGPEGPAGKAPVVHRASFSQVFEANEGIVDGRSLGLEKASPTSQLRVTYQDILSASGQQPCSCAWSVLFNGEPCATPGPLGTISAGGAAATQTISGYCQATESGPLEQGQVELSVEVVARDGCECTTGDIVGTGLFEVQEISTEQ